jgi:hypothetical protein
MVYKRLQEKTTVRNRNVICDINSLFSLKDIYYDCVKLTHAALHHTHTSLLSEKYNRLQLCLLISWFLLLAVIIMKQTYFEGAGKVFGICLLLMHGVSLNQEQPRRRFIVFTLLLTLLDY